MQQVIFIHGGEVFDTHEEYLDFLRECCIEDPFEDKEEVKRWKHTLSDELGDGYGIAFLQMPNKLNAKYDEWKIWFEKYIPFLKDQSILIGHSLGANFLAKYLAEHTLPCPVSQLHLVAGCFGVGGGFSLPEDMSRVEDQCERIVLYHSMDDLVVPFADANQYKQALPKAELVVFEGRGHFLGEDFPELIEQIMA